MPRPFNARALVIASHNPDKVHEIRGLLAPFDVEAVPAGDLNLPEPDETEATFAANAALKALSAARGAARPALADDSGLAVKALNGDPGVHSARWAAAPRDVAAAMAMVNQRLGGAKDRGASFLCALCLAWPDGHTETVEGRIEGDIVWPPRGERGFGYDPIFIPKGHAVTFGEMQPSQKRAISHRARAFARLAERCFKR